MDDEDYLSKPYNPEMEEQNLETADKCGPIIELGVEIDETASYEGKPVEVGGGDEGNLGNNEFILDDVAEVIELPATEGGGEISDDPPLETRVEEDGNRVDDVDRETVVSDTVDLPAFTESNESLVDSKFETKDEEEEFAPAVTESEAQINPAADEMVVDPQLDVAVEDEYESVVEPELEVVVSDVVDTQPLSESEMNACGDDLEAAMDGVEGMEALDDSSKGLIGDEKDDESVGVMGNLAVDNDAEGVVEGDEVDEAHEGKIDVVVDDDAKIGSPVNTSVDDLEALDDKFEEPMGDEKNDGAVGVMETQPVESWVVENSLEAVVEVDKVDEEKIDVVVDDDTEIGSSVKPSEIEEEEDDAVVAEEVPIAETDVKMVTEVNACVGDGGEQEQGDEATVGVEDGGDVRSEHDGDKEVSAEEGLMSRTKVVVEENVEFTESMLDVAEPKETTSDEDEPGQDIYDSPAALQEEEDEAMVAEEDMGTQDMEMETETDIAESGKTASGGKRKRGKLTKSPISKAPTKGSSRKTVGEDVCFICFDGGELVLCDRRGCPKAYHPSCVNRDEAFFKSKGRWNCGWHLCSICEKNARYMCFTCTYSLCKSCIKEADAVILCVRGNKGFCETCMRTVKLIESNEQGNKDTQIDFDDRSSWEYLFKDYYIELKAKLSLSSVDIAEAKNPWKGADMLSGPSKQESSEAHADANDGGSGSDDSIENIETIKPKRRKTRKQSKSLSREEEVVSTGVAAAKKAKDNSEWASKELLEFVSHTKNGDTSVLSQFDVQALLLEYIKINRLRDPRRKSQIICDARLENIFGKPRVGHFEMLKLLESHFLVRDEQNDDFQGSVVDTENNQLDIDSNGDPLSRGVKDRKRKSRKKSDRGPQSNLDDYAAIDMHNIGLIYMRRKLMEDLLEDAEMFHDKVKGTFVRIRISGSNQKQDLYRLVPVVGTHKAAEPYKIGKKTTDTMVEILNLDKSEVTSIDTISNQDFTEEECKRLRQSIKCGLINQLTVGDILEKTTEIQAARVNDWLESETLRLSHLRDRASDLGRRKELRECVEKLQLLKTPEERRRRLDEIPEIHADPKMDPNYESDDKDSESEDNRRDAFLRSRGVHRRAKGPISPGSDNSTKVTSKNWESSKYLSSSSSFGINASHGGEIVNENSWNLEREKDTEESNYLEKRISGTNSEFGERAPQPVARPESFSVATSVIPSQASLAAGVVETAVKINELEKIWHYKDPSGKVQGPFSMVQLRKWNNTGYFPADLRIWRATEKQDNSILLADALEGKFPKESPAVKTPESNVDHNSSKLSAEKWLATDTTNLPSPTPKQRNSGWDVVDEKGVLSGAIHQTPGGVNGVFSSPTPVLPSAVASVLNSIAQTGAFSPTPNSQQGTPVGPTVSQHAQTSEQHAHPLAVVQPAQPVICQNLQSGQPQGGYGWIATPNVPNPSGSFSNSPTGLQPDVWRPNNQSSQQPNMPPPAAATPNASSWGVGPIESNATAVGVRPENPNIGWGPMPANQNMAWGNMPPGNNASMNWGPAMPVGPPTGNTPGWVAPNNNQGPAGGYANPGWGTPPPVQGPVIGNGWGPPSGNAGGPSHPPAVQGGPPPPQGNMNHQGGSSWGGEQNHNMGGGGRFSGPRGGRGRDSGYGGGGPRPWNRQSSFGSGGFRRRETPCPYNANGRCRKGAYCDYLHT